MLRSLSPWCVAVVLGAWIPAPGRAADPQEPAPLKLSEDEQKVLDLTNEARAAEKLPPVKPNAQLTEAARGHSANMHRLLRNGDLQHVLEGKTPGDRVKATGYRFASVGENIGWTDGDPPAVVFKDWMESKGHRANILNGEFTETGIGSARNDKGETYYTQVFARPKKKPAP